MLLAHHRDRIARLREPTVDDPWRTLLSGCLAGWQCGVEASDYGLGKVFPDLLALPTLELAPFCPEQHAMGTPRTMPDIHGGDGFDVIAGRARVVDEHGTDLTEKMLEGARAMLAHARQHDVELAILTDMSAACGSQVISLGCRFDDPRKLQKGVGVATAMLLEDGIPVVAQRDHHSIDLLRARLDATFDIGAGRRDHHEHEWTVEFLPDPHPRLSFGSSDE